MADNLSPQARLKTMRAVKSKQTRPERLLRSLLASLGYSGWKLNFEEAPGKPDIAFPDAKIAIFVDGCFWHQCPHCKRPLPKTNADYWATKIQRNVERDRNYDLELQDAGWKVIRLWEHQFRKKQWPDLVKELRNALIRIE